MSPKGAANKNPWTVEVDVYLEEDTDPPKFRVESFLQSQTHGKLVFHNRRRPGFDISFNLIDQTNSGYRFPGPPNLDEAVWSQLGADNCPKSAVADVFSPLRVIKNGTTLVVHNANPCPEQGDFTYTLRVTKDGTNFLDLDPGGSNQNGPFY